MGKDLDDIIRLGATFISGALGYAAVKHVNDSHGVEGIDEIREAFYGTSIDAMIMVSILENLLYAGPTILAGVAGLWMVSKFYLGEEK